MGTAVTLKLKLLMYRGGKNATEGVFDADLFSRGNFYFLVKLSSEKEMGLHFSKADNNV